MARKLRPPRPKQQAGLTAGEPPPPAEGEILAPARPAGVPRIGYVDRELCFTAEQRAIVKEMATYGTPFRSICQMILNPDTGLPVTKETLARHFRAELDAGMAIADSEIARSAYLQAVGWPAEYDENGKKIRDYLAPVPMMTKWLTQSRLGFKDTVVIESSPGQMTVEAAGQFVATLSYEDMLRVREIASRVRSGESDAPG